jgi:hypothetical protein
MIRFSARWTIKRGNLAVATSKQDGKMRKQRGKQAEAMKNQQFRGIPI